MDDERSINRLLETASAMALQAVKTGDQNTVTEAIDLMVEAEHKLLMYSIERGRVE